MRWREVVFGEWTTLDDRGSRVRLWQPRGHDADDPFEHDLAQRTTQVIKSTAWKHALIASLSMFGGMFAAKALGASILLSLALALLLMVVILAWGSSRTRRGINPAIRLTLLSEARCASCAYDLAGVRADTQGRTHCPECRSAWRLSEDAVADREARQSLWPRKSADPEETASDRRASRGLRLLLVSINWKRRFACRDASGRIVPLVGAGPFPDRPARWNKLPPDLRREIRWELNSFMWLPRLVLGLLVLPMMFVMAYYFLRLGIPRTAQAIAFSSVIVFVHGIYFPVFWVGFLLHPWTRGGKSIVKAMLARRLCPSCLAGLASVEPNDEGNIHCPACRALWPPSR